MELILDTNPVVRQNERMNLYDEHRAMTDTEP